MNQPMQIDDWEIDKSAGRPILIYKGCSIIEGSDAEFVLGAIKAALSAKVQDVAEIKTSIDTMRVAAKEALFKKGWVADDTILFRSVTELMAEFGMQLYRGDIGCGYPRCGCCADAACKDAMNQHSDFTATSAKQEARHDLGQLETRLINLISEHPEKAQLAAVDDYSRTWFIAELIAEASGSIPLLEIEGLVSRHLATMEGGEA